MITSLLLALVLPFEMPYDGKAMVVIDDAAIVWSSGIGRPRVSSCCETNEVLLIFPPILDIILSKL